MRESNRQEIYGIERNDEIGLLSNTIQDLFVKGYYDGLTGIYNRRYMEITLRQIMASMSRMESKLSVMMIDADHFKKYNDTYGHSEGDTCLAAVAKALAETLSRADDFVSRYGGEEFSVILPNTDESGARYIAGKLLDSIRALNVPHAKSDAAGCVTISVGVTTGFVQQGVSGADYIKRADEALYMSKQSGRNRYTFIQFEEV
jgi:diguanylate cyclase (GGDEF)-like protein